MANEGSTKPTELERALDIMTEKYKSEHGYVESAREERDQIAKTCDLLRAENSRVRGLLQRQWISVEERLPETQDTVLAVADCSHIGAFTAFYCGGKWYATDDRGEPMEATVGFQDVTHWMLMPTFPQSSSLVPEGAESADIGKLDSVDKSGCNLCGASIELVKSENVWRHVSPYESRLCP